MNKDYTKALDIRWIDMKSGYSCHGTCLKWWERWYDGKLMLKMIDKLDGTIHKIKYEQITDFKWN